MTDATSPPAPVPGGCPVCGSGSSAEIPCERCGHMTHFTWKDRDGADVLMFLDSVVTPEIVARINSSLNGRKGEHLMLDFSKVEFVPSATLGKMLTLHKDLQAGDGRLELCGLDANLRNVLRLTRLDGVFRIV